MSEHQDVMFYGYPNPDEIKKYVSIGPTRDYSVTMYKETFDKGFILFIIIFCAAIIIFAIIMIIIMHNITKINPVTRTITYII